MASQRRRRRRGEEEEAEAEEEEEEARSMGPVCGPEGDTRALVYKLERLAVITLTC